MGDKEILGAMSDKEALQKIEDFLFDETKVRFIFDPPAAARAGIYPEKSGDETGRLVRSFSLVKLHQSLGLGEVSEEKILSLLDSLTAQRKVKVFSLKIPPNNRFDLYFVTEVGIGLFGFRPPKTITGSALLKIIFYRDQPHDLSGGVAKPSTRAIYLRQQRDAAFERRFPKIDMTLQSAIRSEERLSNARFENSVLDLLEKVNKKLDQKT